ncbi:proteic killer suppression protein [Flavobacterium sp. CG_9.1]|uniref:type II toxin-antitoxin system RelE/ParE family toxin n=1 Tax=Flavobacterium sp. CG_9.1 TaxID=2787728 RepID=UPI0018C980CB|nr:type II toxin-antitoxin system RelE/ParE family toxin [Flavobacterium sp. CG_9.1]MBG6063254.1 proteic killer suppression protein [Flavobacterium sp. CG_9.1]
MIISFGSKETEKIWNGIVVRKPSIESHKKKHSYTCEMTKWAPDDLGQITALPEEIQKIGRRKLRMLNNSQDLNDLRIPPSNRLEKLKGTLKDFYSIRINNQWRIIFIWKDGNSTAVEIIDYH